MKSIFPEETDKNKLKGFSTRYIWVKQFAKGKDILEAACGSGYGTTFYDAEVKAISGIDLDDVAIDYARTHYLHNFLKGDIRNMPFQDNKFDMVISFETLEHLHHAEGIKFLSEVNRVLHDTGLFVGSTPCMKAHSRFFPDKKSGEHCVLYHVEDLKKQLAIFRNLKLYNIVSWAGIWTAEKIPRKKIDIVLLSFDRVDKTKTCINSIYRHCKSMREMFNIIVIENGSIHSIQDKILLLKNKYPDIKIVFNRENIGVSMGRALGLNYCEGEYVIFLDNDMEVTEGWLENLLLRFAENDNVAAVCSKVIKDGRAQLNGRFIKNNRIDYSRDNVHIESPIANDELACDIIHGGATIYRRKVFRDVSFSNDYFIGYEDLDLMLQLKSKGYQLLNCPKSVVIHNPDYSGRYAKARRDNFQITKSKEIFEKRWKIKT